MPLVAGLDVGNSTTEIAVARVEPGAHPDWLFIARRPTTAAKGTVACAAGVADLLARAEQRLGERPHLTLLAELNPVETDLLELGRIEELALERTAIARPASETPSGAGVGAGRLVGLDDLTGPPGPETVVAVAFDSRSRSITRMGAGASSARRRRPKRSPVSAFVRGAPSYRCRRRLLPTSGADCAELPSGTCSPSTSDGRSTQSGASCAASW